MNNIKLTGIIDNIEFSHMIQGIEFYKATLLTKNEKGKEDLINLKFKRFSCPYKNGDLVSLQGNIRTYSKQLSNGKNVVYVYAFTYFDMPEVPEINKVFIDGKICKISPLRKTKNGKDVVDLILANNIELPGEKSLSCYIPVVAWGANAKKLAKCNIGDYLDITGTLIAREYKKRISENDFEIRIAYEVNINEVN